MASVGGLLELLLLPSFCILDYRDGAYLTCMVGELGFRLHNIVLNHDTRLKYTLFTLAQLDMQVKIGVFYIR